jgi:hypothetical protein
VLKGLVMKSSAPASSSAACSCGENDEVGAFRCGEVDATAPLSASITLPIAGSTAFRTTRRIGGSSSMTRIWSRPGRSLTPGTGGTTVDSATPPRVSSAIQAFFRSRDFIEVLL